MTRLVIIVYTIHHIVPDTLQTASAQAAMLKCPLHPPPLNQNKTQTSINLANCILFMNCQSIQNVEKGARFYALLDQHKPDIVVGTESWLHEDVLDSEVLPSSLGFNPPIRRDRPPGTKGGGVFILVSQRLVVTEQRTPACYRL